jgi:hypothetical protein
MLKTISAALVATALVASTAFAAQPSASTGATNGTSPAASAVQAPAKQTATNPTAGKQAAVNPVSKVKHASLRRRHHVAHAAKPGMSKTVKSAA